MWPSRCFLVFAAIPAASATESSGPTAPAALRCEYLDNPIGIDVAKPRFFWIFDHPERGQVQSAYQVLVSTDPKAAAGDVWDSGKVASPKSIQVVFAGKALESGKSYYWKVRTWDRGGAESPWSAVARFDTGLFNKSEWKGVWIGKKNQLRKEFALKGRVKRARAYCRRARLLRAAGQRPQGRQPRPRPGLDDLRQARPLRRPTT